MRTFKLAGGDIAFDLDRSIVMTSGNDEIAQSLERVFTTNQGEWFFNALHGLAYERIQGKGVTDENIQLAIIEAALQEPRVAEVLEINIERDNPRRKVAIGFLCRIDTGEEIKTSFGLESTPPAYGGRGPQEV